MTSAVYNYQNEAALWLPMTAECHDPTNVRTLDLSKNKLHATFGNGATLTTYPTKLPNRGYYLDGGDYLDCGNQALLDFTTVGSVAALFKTTSVVNSYQVLICKQDWTTGKNGYSLYIDNSTNILWLDLRNAVGANSRAFITLPRNLDPVHFCAGWWTGSKVYLYLDGYIVSANQTINPSPELYNFRIGAISTASAYWYTGNIHWAGAWNTALSEIQVRDLEARLRRELNDV